MAEGKQKGKEKICGINSGMKQRIGGMENMTASIRKKSGNWKKPQKD